MISKSLPWGCIALNGRKEEHPPLWVSDAVQETWTRGKQKSSRLGPIYPAGRTKVWGSASHGPHPPHACMRAHTQPWDFPRSIGRTGLATVAAARCSPGHTQVPWRCLWHVYKEDGWAGEFLAPREGYAWELVCEGLSLTGGSQLIVNLLSPN